MLKKTTCTNIATSRHPSVRTRGALCAFTGGDPGLCSASLGRGHVPLRIPLVLTPGARFPATPRRPEPTRPVSVPATPGQSDGRPQSPRAPSAATPHRRGP